jgi:very-short-patch-repair endonuclease
MNGERITESPLPSREGVRGRGPTLRARSLRQQSTEAEKKLWHHLRRKQFHGLRFRRQYPLGPHFFGDFVCLPARLVIEVDGRQHAEGMQLDHDERRTQWLRTQNFRILRFWNVDVFGNIEGVLDMIDAAVREPPPPAPSREGRGKAIRKEGKR